MGLGADEPKRKGLVSRPIVLVIVVLAAIALVPYSLLILLTPVWKAVEVPINHPGRVLLVTAHPDDETVFFGPAITALHARGSEVYLLCLTTGNAHGLGQTRVEELKLAAAALKIDQAHLRVKDEQDRLPDSKSLEWDQPFAQSLIDTAVKQWRIRTIITFDKGGVTGHKNHQSCWQAVRTYVSDCLESCPTAWSLVSAGKWRQYSLMFDDTEHEHRRHKSTSACYLTHSLFEIFHAMYHHKTQWRWWSHVLFTRYTYVNRLRMMVPSRPPVALT